MTIKDVKKMYAGEYDSFEVWATQYVGDNYPTYFHTDNCLFVDDDTFTIDSEVGLYELMNEDKYNASILANCDIFADFEEWFGNKNAKILCVMLK